MPALTERQLAYMAGIVDVMGSLRLREVRGTMLPFVEVACPNFSLLEWLGTLTGTGVTRVKRDYKRNGCAVHCPERHVHILSHSGRWSLSGVRATVAVAALLPFLQLQVEAAQQLLDVGLRANRKAATITKMAELGWPLPQFLPPQPHLKVIKA